MGEGENHGEITPEYPAQQPAQSPGQPRLVLAGGEDGPHWVRDDQRGGVAGQEVGEELQAGVGRAQDHSAGHHVVSAGTESMKDQFSTAISTYFGSEPRCLSLC